MPRAASPVARPTSVNHPYPISPLKRDSLDNHNNLNNPNNRDNRGSHDNHDDDTESITSVETQSDRSPTPGPDHDDERVIDLGFANSGQLTHRSPWDGRLVARSGPTLTSTSTSSSPKTSSPPRPSALPSFDPSNYRSSVVNPASFAAGTSYVAPSTRTFVPYAHLPPRDPEMDWLPAELYYQLTEQERINLKAYRARQQPVEQLLAHPDFGPIPEWLKKLGALYSPPSQVSTSR